MKPGLLIQLDWFSSQEGSEMIRVLLQPNSYERRHYGFLERPNLPSQIEEFHFKIYVSSGKAGIGKTSTVHRLAGTDPNTAYETAGINVTAVYWPVKLIHASKVILFRLEFWDSSEIAHKKFAHVVPSCREGMAAVMFLFSFTDKSSFDSIPDQMSNVLSADDSACPIIVGTRYDLQTNVDVTAREVREFERQSKLPVIRMKNVPSSENQNNKGSAQRKAEFDEVALALNTMCEQLWSRNQGQI